MNPDGSGILHIDRPGDQFYPTTSPDGTRIAYHITSRDREGVYVINSDGSGQDLLVFDNNSGTVDFAHPDWSPDGKKLVAMGYRPECQLPCDNWRYDIYTMNSDGTGQPTNLTNTKGTGEGFPSWSSTGKIAFESSYPVESAEYYSNPHGDIYVINPDGTGRTNLTNTADRRETFPAYSPDGTQIAYEATATNETNKEIFRMNSDGSQQERLTDTPYNENRPSWSPDGSQIAFSAFKAAETNASQDIFKMRSDGTGENNITLGVRYTNNPSASSFEGHPDWGPSSFSYDFGGFFRPVDNLPTFNKAKAGRSVPVKFSLRGDQGVDILAEGNPKSEQIDCDSTAPVDTVEQAVSAGESHLVYDATTDQYTYVWKTEKRWAGTCRQFTIKLKDSSVHQASFEFE
jgi:dipeptidyl aminopeptidase/acylaminoacyl peptidase